MGVPLAEDAERLEPVHDRSAKANTAGFIEIPHRNGHVADLESEVDALEQELRIENEVVAVALEGNGFEHGAGVGAEAAVPFAKILTGHDVFHERESAVHEILDGRHVAAKRLGPRADAVTQNDIANSEG